MLSLKSRQDRWKLHLPKELIPDELVEKYTKILRSRKSFFETPIDFLNESIQKVQILGFQNATFQQKQSRRSSPTFDDTRIDEDNFLYSATDFQYRSVANPEEIIDKTINIQFRLSVGYINYFILFESFFYQYSRDMKTLDNPRVFSMDIYNEFGEIYCRVVFYDPLIDGMDMLDLDFSQPIAQSQTFQVSFKYSNIDFQFIENKQ